MNSDLAALLFQSYTNIPSTDPNTVANIVLSRVANTELIQEKITRKETGQMPSFFFIFDIPK